MQIELTLVFDTNDIEHGESGVTLEDVQEYAEACNLETARSMTGYQGFRVTELKGVYGEWCRDPLACIPRGFCPKDPTCAD